MDSKIASSIRGILDLIERNSILPTDNLVEKRNKYIEGLNKAAILLPNVDVNSQEVIDLIDEEYLFQPLTETVFEYDYKPWLNEARLTVDFDFYDRYERYLKMKKMWDKPTMASLNRSSDTILDHLRNPKSGNFFTCKGLVLGDIQSGKTANYTALINKALDTGYKLVIVLAGLTDDLRKQTQLRLDKEVLGYETREDASHGKSIGVATMGGNKHLLVDCLTYNDKKGDFKGTKSTFALSDNANPILAVVKKQKNVLENLLMFISRSPENCYTNGKLDIPVLIIDDEADQASPDTRNSDSIENASAINKCIRNIIDKCNRCSYVGYTATPFANVFINPTSESNIFPEHFIIALPPARGYSGIDDYFSISDDSDTEVSYDLCTFVKDFDDFFTEAPKRLTATTQVDKLAQSLIDAIINFVIAASIKKSRGIVEHNSMLINIASVKCPATTLVELVKEKISDLYYEYRYESVDDKYFKFWEERIKPISERRLGNSFSDSWEEIEPFIIKTYQNLFNDGIKLLNGDSKDVIDYDILSAGDWIIVGGNRLSRGLTLEGLVVSYFYRNSKQYDTLLQMGRWFGFRKGWLDLCRVYIDEDIVKSFVDVGIALHELREDIEVLNDDENYKTPMQFGLKIRTSPKLIPTARNKMRTASKTLISFSGRQSQVLSFDPDNTSHNFELTEKFIHGLNDYIELKNGKVIFKNVSSEDLMAYLSGYEEAKLDSGSVEVKNWVNYIRKRNENNNLLKWTVVLSSLQGDNGRNEKVDIDRFCIFKSRRSDRNAGEKERPKVFKLRVNTNPTDFRDAFYDIPEMKGVDTYSVTDKRIDKYFTEDNGVISIQITDICYKIPTKYENGRQRYETGEVIEDGKDVIGLTIWFPKSSDNDLAVEYYTNLIYQTNEEKQTQKYLLGDQEDF